MTHQLNEDRLARERAFHDQLAVDLDPSEMPPVALDHLDGALLRLIGDLRGKHVLDLGCGSGDLTLALSLAGAKTTGVDLSRGMVEVAEQRTAFFAPDAETDFVVAAVEALPINNEAFDVIIGRFILHHLDIPAAAAECARVLRQDGMAIFAENSGRNPILMFARNHLTGRFGIPRYGTPDERPLSSDDVESLRSRLPDLQLEYPVFEFFSLFDRQVLRFRWGLASKVLSTLDRAIWSWIPPARPWSFRVVVVASA